MNYLNFDIDAFDYSAADSKATFRVRVARSPSGEQRVSDAPVVGIDYTALRPLLTQLERRQLDLSGMIDLGALLGDALFPPAVRALLQRSRERLEDHESLRLRLRFDVVGLSSLPWEYAYVPKPDAPTDRRSIEGFLALDRSISIVRYELMQQASGTLDPVAGSELRLVALLSDPKSADYPALDLAAEAKQIREALTDASVVKPEFHEHATLDTLQDALVKPAHIFHFAGHGDFEAEMGEKLGEIEGRGFLVLVGDDGGAFHFGAEKLAQTLNRRGVRLAVLGACQGGRRDGLNPWTGVAPALTRAGIPAVVAMQLSIRDRNAVAFSRRFYRALAKGETIDFAVTDGRIAIFNRAADDDERDWGVPVLYMRADEGTLFPSSDGASAQGSGTVNAAQTNIQTGAGSVFVAEKQPGTVTPPVPAGAVDKVQLRSAMIQSFSEADLELLCADLTQRVGQEISLEIVGGGSKPIKVLNLIQYMDRRAWLPYLIEAVRLARPGLI